MLLNGHSESCVRILGIKSSLFLVGVAQRPLPSVSNSIPGFHGQDLKAQPRPMIVSNLGALGAEDVVLFVYFN